MGGFEGYYGQTSLHPVALGAIIFLSIAAFVLPRRFSVAPLLIAATTLPMAQRLVIAGADFTLLRLLLVAYLLRLIFRGEWKNFSFNKVDYAVIFWFLSGTVIMTLNHGSVAAFINRLGWSYDIFLTYFSVRILVRSMADIKYVAIFSALISLPMAGVFLVEWLTRNNVFAVFGGVPPITGMREGRLRCQGPFPHPIIAGTFWASMLPLIAILIKERAMLRVLAVVGFACGVLIVILTSSSTPILSVMAGIFGFLAYRIRDYRTAMWLAIIFVIALLHFVLMNNPVWHLMARVDFVGGSTGWHRFLIFDTFVNNFSKWYLLGEADPLSWGVWQMRDITNQYVLEGLRGGLLTLIFFILVLLRSFGNVGKSLSLIANNEATSQKRHDWVIWMVGVGVFVHVVTFFGVSYFGQMTALLYLQLALAGSVFLAASSDREIDRKVV